MKINSKELLSILSELVPGLASKEVLEQSKCFIFTGGWVCTYNDQIMVQRPFDMEIEEDLIVNAQELLKLLTNMVEQEIDITFDGKKLHIKGKRSKTKIPVQNEIKLPVNDISIPEEMVTVPEDLMEALSFCLFTCGKDTLFPILTCICINGAEVVSSDNIRGTRYTMESEMGFEEDILLPHYVVSNLVKYNVHSVAVETDWIHFFADNDIVFSCRTVEGEFPNTEPLFEDDDMIEFTLPDTEVLDSLERAQIFSKTGSALDDHVTLKLSEGAVYITGNSDRGTHTERLKLEEEVEEEIFFSIHPSFLRQIIQRESYTMKQNGSKLLVEGENFDHVALLYAEDEGEG